LHVLLMQRDLVGLHKTFKRVQSIGELLDISRSLELVCLIAGLIS